MTLCQSLIKTRNGIFNCQSICFIKQLRLLSPGVHHHHFIQCFDWYRGRHCPLPNPVLGNSLQACLYPDIFTCSWDLVASRSCSLPLDFSLQNFDCRPPCLTLCPIQDNQPANFSALNCVFLPSSSSSSFVRRLPSSSRMCSFC